MRRVGCAAGVVHQGDRRVDDRVSDLRVLRPARVRARQRRLPHGRPHPHADRPTGVATSRLRTLRPHQLAGTSSTHSFIHSHSIAGSKAMQ